MNRIRTRLHRRFLRDPEHGYLGGVCEGIARGLALPANLVRAMTVLAAVLATTPVVIAYAAAWLLMDSREEILHS